MMKGANDFSPKSSAILQQRCVRHISFFCIRNLTCTLSTLFDPLSTTSLLYFTLHASSKNNTMKNADDVYRSEDVTYCLNPTWSSFCISNCHLSYLTDFTVSLWIINENASMLIHQWKIALKQLSCIGTSLCSDKVSFNSNAVVFGMYGFYYSLHTSLVSPASDMMMFLSFDKCDVRKSYNVFALRRILSCKLASSRCMKEVNLLIQLIQKRIAQQRSTMQLKIELEDMQQQLYYIHSLHKREQLLLANEKITVNKKRTALQKREADLASKQTLLKSDYTSYREASRECLQLNQTRSHLITLLGVRRHELLWELSRIFPISAIPESIIKSQKKPSAPKLYAICDVILPEAENFNSKEDLPTSVALGYTAQLLSAMSAFLSLPLRYPIVLMGSHSSVVNDLMLSDKANIPGRSFPIYIKGKKDRMMFDYGVFLLNKNVAQLRFYCGLGTRDLRLTLSNIKTLLEERLGAKSMLGRHSQPIAITNPRRTARLLTSPSTLRLPKHPGEPRDSYGVIPTSVSAFYYRVIHTSPHSHTDDDISSPLDYISSNSVNSPHNVKKFNQPAIIRATINLPQRMEIRNNEFSHLRDELLGERSAKKAKEKAQVQDKRLVKAKRATSDSLFLASNIFRDSVDTIAPQRTPHHRRLTGLEEAGKHHEKEAKENLAAARAELFGKKLSRGSRSFRRWSRRGESYSEDLPEEEIEVFEETGAGPSATIRFNPVEEKEEVVTSHDDNSVSPSTASGFEELNECVVISSEDQSKVARSSKKSETTAVSDEKLVPPVAVVATVEETLYDHSDHSKTSSNCDVFFKNQDDGMSLILQDGEEFDLC